jgi:hypothetical protein
MEDDHKFIVNKCLSTWRAAQGFCESMGSDPQSPHYHVGNLVPFIQKLRSKGYDQRLMAWHSHRGISLRPLHFRRDRDPIIDIHARPEGGMMVRLRGPGIHMVHDYEHIEFSQEVEALLSLLLMYPVVIDMDVLREDPWWK